MFVEAEKYLALTPLSIQSGPRFAKRKGTQ